MPDLPSEAVARRTPPLLSVWFTPRQTIERIVAERPHHLILPLAILGGVAASTSALITAGVAGVLQDWRVCLTCILIGAVLGGANLYVSAIVVAWLGRRIGGRASTAAVRAVFAWGMVPMIFGQLVVLLIAAGLLESAASITSRLLILWLPIVTGIVSLWSVIVTLLMLSRVAQLGFLRTMASYWLGVPPLLVALASFVGLLASGASVTSPEFTPWLPILGGMFGLWLAIVVSLILPRAERFGFRWTMVHYWLSAPLLAALLASFVVIILFQPFCMPRSSMAPTLFTGDYFLVSKYAYGYSRYSLPFSPPLFSGRIRDSQPERGDVVVFRLQKDVAFDVVKRVVGFPGERIQMKQGLLYIDDVPVVRERLEDLFGPDLCGYPPARAERWRKPCRTERAI